MVFSSLIFLFLFLPAFLAVYYLAPFRARSLVILIGSYVFYAWWRVDFLLLFAGVTLWNYVAARMMLAAPYPGRAGLWLKLGVTGDLLTLGLFKYFNFGVDSLNAALTASGLNTVEALPFILPIGISFYIFQSISFLVDVHRGDAHVPPRFVDFAAFISLFPQLIAGPVLRYKDVADQFGSRTHSFSKFSQGAYRFMQGFAKKVLIADTVADLADKSFALENPSMADAWLGALAYALQLYYDFSGYSDMAVGLGLMMGFRFVENFNAPYISQSITEFWRRWHISLSTWLRDYLYIPLGGNRKGRARTYVNLLLTMVLGGLWHGANWTFVIWGAWHGGLLAIERALKWSERGKATAASALQLLLTFFLVLLGWVMFRAPDAGRAFDFYQAMFSGAPEFSEALSWQISGAAITAMIAGYILTLASPMLEKRYDISFRENRNGWLHGGMAAVFVLAVMKLAAKDYSPFLYFQF